MGWEQSHFFWIALGIVLIICEIFTAAFVLLFFGVSALVVAAIHMGGLHNFYGEIILFAAIGLSALFIFRRRLVAAFLKRDSRAVDGLERAQIVVDSPIAPGETGTVMHLGTPWIAINKSQSPLNSGDKAIVERIDGVKLILKKI